MTRIESCLRTRVNSIRLFYLLPVGMCLCAISMVFAPAATGQATEKVLYRFTGDSNGAVSSLVRDAAGNLYGTTFYGGTTGNGTVFKLDPTGKETVLYSFGVANGSFYGDGTNPQAGLIMDSAGNLYGTTASGTSNSGTVFKLDPTGKETVLWTFVGCGICTDGNRPQAGLIMDSAGNLYGTTRYGGQYRALGDGIVFKLDPTGTETILYAFTGGADGAHPQAGLIQDGAGNLYGTTYDGGAGLVGVVFKVDPTGHETVLHAFTGMGGDGANPQDALILDSAGSLYGTTLNGGATGQGTIFKVTPAGQETVLYSFTGTDGAHPQGGVTMDSAGNLYGTTLNGGATGHGTIFKVTPTGQETVLYSLTGTNGDGSQPQVSVILDAAANLYGTTWLGGATGGGTIFKLDPSAQETVLYSFAGRNGDGTVPAAGLIMDSAGNLYGTTLNGGTSTSGTGVSNDFTGGGVGTGVGYGTAFKLDPTGKETALHNFGVASGDGVNPQARLIMDSAGNLYGTTYNGGTTGNGTVFKRDSAGNETVLYSFKGTSNGDGANPQAGLILDSAGNLYGTTTYGGTPGAGTVFKLDPAGTETVLHSFGVATDGTHPIARLIMDSKGTLYGTTYDGGTQGSGTVFKVDPTGTETVLHNFTGQNGSSSNDGGAPYAGLIMDSKGILYGTTAVGGTGNGSGTVFKLDPKSGRVTVLFSFGSVNGQLDGVFPHGELVMDGKGNLYGTTSSGVVFKVAPKTGQETVLYTFTDTNGDGGDPEGALIMDSAGNLYGTTARGGQISGGCSSGCGTVFVVTP